MGRDCSTRWRNTDLVNFGREIWSNEAIWKTCVDETTVLKFIFTWWKSMDWIYFAQDIVQLRVVANIITKPSAAVKGNKFHGWVTTDFKDQAYRPTHAAYGVQMEQDASTSSVTWISSVNIMNWKFFFRRRNKEQINLLKTKCRLLNLHTQFVPRCEHFSSRL
jgi:hypothetical protein